LWTGHLCRPKKGALGWENQAGQGHQDHGHCRRPWSSSRLADRKCFAGLSETGHHHAGGADSGRRAKKADGKTIDFTGHPTDTLANARAGDDFGLYYNATDLGAGRRVGMNYWKDTDNQQSVAYYAATYPTLSDAVNDTNVKYIACMDYAPGGGGRFVRFYVFDGTGKQLRGIDSEKQSAETVYIPGVCMVCHGSARVNQTKADVGGQFIAFDTANFTFTKRIEFSYPALTANAARAALPESGILAGNKNVFCSLNDGLLTGKRSMPTDLSSLITNLAKNNASFYAGPAAKVDGFAKNWVTQGAPAATKAAQTKLYTSTYAVSCRSCHSTQREISFPTAAEFLGGLAPEKAEKTMAASIMPQSQRAYSIFWGSHTGAFLNNTLNNAPYNRQQAVISQPASISPDDNPKVK
jgi:mono/diheme cytochrome c family protein